MHRQSSEQQIFKLQNFWKLAKDSKGSEGMAYNPLNYQSTKTLNTGNWVNEPVVQAKWDSPMVIKPAIPIFQAINQKNPTRQWYSNAAVQVEDPKNQNLIAEHPEESLTYDNKTKKPEKLTQNRVKRTEKLKKKTANYFEIKLISNWGDPSTIGLSQIELFDEASNLIPTLSKNIGIKHSSNDFDPFILINNHKHSLDPYALWTSTLPQPPKKIRIFLRVPLVHSVCGVKIWNYTRPGLESSKCTKDIELRLNNEKVWRGSLRRGDVATEIPLLVGFTFINLDIKIQQMLNSEARLITAPKNPPSSNVNSLRKYIKSDVKLNKSPFTQPALLKENVESDPQLIFGYSQESEEIKESKPLKIEDLSAELIPVNPTGRVLKFNLLSSWGDQHYIGLCGIEFWDNKGDLIEFQYPALQLQAWPPGLEVLPEYKNDIRTIDKLVDGTYWTCDDSHVWLTPFYQGKSHWISIDFLKPTSLSMIRIWNFNKSRIHCSRGVKDIEIIFDQAHLIFRGEVGKAPGSMKGAEQACEYVILTDDEKVIDKIASNDWVEGFKEDEVEFPEVERPGTPSKEPRVCKDGRPMTRLVTEPDHVGKGVKATEIKINIVNTWGDAYYAGLTGISVMTSSGVYSLERKHLFAKPEDLNSIQGHSGDYRTLEKLVNNVNQTTDDKNMWLIPFKKGYEHYLIINLGKPYWIQSLIFWNYNKSLEDTHRGIKIFDLSFDGVLTYSGLTLKKAPGHSLNDYSQTIPLPLTLNEEFPSMTHSITLGEYVTPACPQGFILTLRLFSTWGDCHYIGLNGLLISDSNGNDITKSNPYLATCIPSLHDLKSMETDPRVPENLFDDINGSINDNHCWLSPFIDTNLHSYSNKAPNTLQISFRDPFQIGRIEMWNYRKTPNRGVKEFDVLVDDAVVYQGRARKWEGGEGPAAVLVFADKMRVEGSDGVVDVERVLMFDEKKHLGGEERKPAASYRPMTGNEWS